MLKFASAGPKGLDCAADDAYWDKLRSELNKSGSEPKRKQRQNRREKADQGMLAEHKRLSEIAVQVKEAISINPDVAEYMMTYANIENIPQYMLSDERYNPVKMSPEEAEYMVSGEIQYDSQPVLDVTGWVVGRPEQEGSLIANNPITGEPVKLPRQTYVIWPSAIRFQGILEATPSQYVIETYDARVKLPGNSVPAREPVSRLNVVGESDGYVMPEPIMDNSRIFSEPNAKLRKLRQKRNFDLQQELVKAAARKAMANDNSAPEKPYSIPQEVLEANHREMLLDLERRRKARVAAYIVRTALAK